MEYSRIIRTVAIPDVIIDVLKKSNKYVINKKLAYSKPLE